MVDPVYALIFVGLALALLVAALIPAPQRPAEEDAGVGLALLSAGCVAALVMGVLALLGLPVATAAVGAVAWLLVMPCIWLARAPQPYDDGWYEEDEDDGGGGSAPPHAPSAPPAPDDRLPGLQPPVAAATHTAWAPAPQPAPVLATAARTQRLLAAQEAERLLAAQEVQRVLAAAAQIPLPQAPAPPAPAPVAPEPVAPAPLHTPQWPSVAPPPRVRADHRSVAHILATFAHARTGRQAATAEKRRARARAALRS